MGCHFRYFHSFPLFNAEVHGRSSSRPSHGEATLIMSRRMSGQPYFQFL